MLETQTLEPNTATDKELVQAALAGERSAYQQLLDRHQDRLFHSISTLTGSSTVAEEIVQEAFINAFLKLHTMRHESGFYTWLYRIALNLRRKHLRHYHRETQISELALDEPTTDARESPPEKLVRAETRAQVLSGIRKLNSRHREILILREFEGFDYQRIADVMGIELGTVRSRLSRARSQLRRLLIEAHANP
ncbi:MAG: sigma-70 family RNA polymerase sigma factor [Planctomycetota bacterium]